LAFFGLGAVLLSGLVFLSLAVEERLDEARRDREEMVASRVFDEMEREISAFLDLEATRPNYVALENTNPETWAPHVVGYFAVPRAQTTERARIVAAEGTTSENRRRIQWALGQAEATWTQAYPEQAPGRGSPNEGDRDQEALGVRPAGGASTAPLLAGPAPAPMTQKAAPSQAKKDVSGTEIIESLNRAKERRRSAPKPEEQQSPDQFQDYTESY
jgi:hypothetical protein